MAYLTLIPRMSEKAYATAQENVYVFNVPLTVNKQQIADAVTEEYSVKVIKVKTLVSKGKAVRFSRGKRSQPGTTHRKDTKKAYVTLAEGDSIDIFTEQNEENK